MSQPIRSKYVILVATDPAEVPPGAVFLDQSTSQMSVKTPAGAPQPIGDSSGTNYFIKSAIAGGAFDINAPVAKRADGKIVLADSDDAPSFIGYAMQASVGDGSVVNIFLVAPNLAGALAGLGFATGNIVYMSKTGGYTNNPNTFDYVDTVIKVGIADCAGGIASSEATDLIAYSEVISEP